MAADISQEAQAAVAGAVRRALAEHGYARLTTAKIADEYDKSEAGLYYYFDTKDEMIAAFLEFITEEQAERLAPVADEDPETQLRTACEAMFRSPGQEGADLHVAIMELLSHAPYTETLREPLLALESATLSALTGIVQRGVDDGTFREDVDPRATAAFLLAAGDGSTGFHVALEMDEGDALRRGWERYVDGLLAQ